MTWYPEVQCDHDGDTYTLVLEDRCGPELDLHVLMCQRCDKTLHKILVPRRRAVTKAPRRTIMGLTWWQVLCWLGLVLLALSEINQ